MKESITKIIFDVVDSKIAEILNGDTVKAGHNGPYYDSETYVRNTAHWISLFGFCYRQSRKEEYKKCVELLGEKIYNSEFKYPNNTYMSRTSNTKDHINGTVGHAWIIEGLIETSSILKNDKYYDLAVRIFLSQHFVDKVGLWSRVEIDDRDIGYDLTLNHQLWFAAAGALICNYKETPAIDGKVRKFLDKCIRFYKILPDGIVNHYVGAYINPKQYIHFWSGYIKKNILDKKNKATLRYKEEGYHLFCMYAFSLLYLRYPEHKLFSSRKFMKSLKISFDERFLDKLSHSDPSFDSTNIGKDNIDANINAYGYPYNAPGFELPFVCKTFFDNDAEVRKKCEDIFEKQIELTYVASEHSFSNNTEDKEVLTARLYELTRAIA